MAKAPIELTGVYVRECVRFPGDTIIGEIEIQPAAGESNGNGQANGNGNGDGSGVTTRIKVKGDCPQDGDPKDFLTPRLTYRFYGRYDNHPKYGRQFVFTDFALSQPFDRAGVMKYLQVYCPGCGIGQQTASTLFDKFRSDAVRVLRESPDVAVAAVGSGHFTLAKAQQAAEYLKRNARIEGVLQDLMGLLPGYGFPRDTAKRAVNAAGTRAAEIIRRRPNWLQRFNGCGFARCDQLYMALGHDPKALKRQAWAASHAISRDTNGHTWFPFQDILRGINERIAGAKVDVPGALLLAKRGKLLATRRDCPECGGMKMVGNNGSSRPCPRCCGTGGGLWVADARKAEAEERLAEAIARATRELDPQEIAKYQTVGTEQREFLDHARCQRCHRKLTAETVAVIDGKPYGPDCVQKVPGGEAAERLPLADWIERHPIIRRVMETVQTGTEWFKMVNAWPQLVAAKEGEPGPSQHQVDELNKATAGRIGNFGGSPGTGKTYTVGCLVKAIVSDHGIDSLRIAAPTGKAAVRVTQAIQSQGLNLKASTIHSLLRVTEKDSGDGWGFEHNHDNPLPYRFIIVDEASMIDTSLAASLLDARASGASILFVGDINQLPPVGHGAPLRDMIAACLPYGELREIRRNSGTIVRAFAQIRDGQRFTVDEKIDLEPASGEPAKNLKVIEASGPEAMTQAMLRCLEYSRRQLGLDAIWDVQILVPVNAKSKLSRKELNKYLQRELNTSGKRVGSNPFMTSDKIVNLKNGFFPLYEPSRQPNVQTNGDGKVFVANGELAEVLHVEDRRTIAKLTNPDRVIVIPRGSQRDGDGEGDSENNEDDKSQTDCSWDLGYTLSIHKSQGSEWPVVIIMLDEYPGARMVFSREAVSTGISRAKKLCLLVGKKETAYGFCQRTVLDKRKTFLKELIIAKGKRS